MCTVYGNGKAALCDDFGVLITSPRGNALLFICRLQESFATKQSVLLFIKLLELYLCLVEQRVEASFCYVLYGQISVLTAYLCRHVTKGQGTETS